MITVFLNNKKYNFAAGLTVYDFLMQNKQLKESMAVTLNNTLILRKDLKTTFLQSNDCVDILIPMQGG